MVVVNPKTKPKGEPVRSNAAAAVLIAIVLVTCMVAYWHRPGTPLFKASLTMEAEEMDGPCTMALVTQNNGIIPLTVSGGNHESSSVSFGKKIQVEHKSSHQKVVASVDPDSGAIAYVFEDQQETKHFVRHLHGPDYHRNSTAEIPGNPDAIHVVGNAVYLGIANTVGWIDFAVTISSPEYKQLLERDDNSYYKSYDLFTRHKDLLVAVDDVSAPFYADGFRINNKGGNPIHAYDWYLESQTNGKYRKAEIVPDGSLLILGSYYACHGYCYGQFLKRFDMAKLDKEKYTNYEVLQDHDKSVTPGTADMSDFDYIGDIDWLDMAVVQQDRHSSNERSGPQVLIAARDRGLFVLPATRQQSLLVQSKIDLGGSVRAVNMCGSVAWALIIQSDHEQNGSRRPYNLVKLSRDEVGDWSNLMKVDLPDEVLPADAERVFLAD